MASNVISEFLVKIGFKVDDAARAKLDANINRTAASLQKFSNNAARATQQFETFGKRVAIAAVAATATLAAFSNRLENLFFFGQRTGVGAGQASALELAFQNIGLAAGQATDSVERLAEKLRYDPLGTQGILNYLGVNAKDAAGKIRNAGDVYLEVLEKISQRSSPYEKSEFLRILELSPKELTQYENNKQKFKSDLKERTEQLEKLQKVLGLNTQAGNEFASGLRRLLQTLQFIGLAIVSRLTGSDGSLIKLNEWLEKNASTIADRLIEALKLAWTVLNETLIPAFKMVVEFLKDLDEKTGGWSTKLIALAVVLNGLGVTSLIGGVLSLAAAIVSLGGALAGLSGVAVAGGVVVLGKVLAAAALIGGVAYLGKKAGDALTDRHNKSRSNSAPGAGGTGMSREGAALEFFQKRGWSREQALGIVANLKAESSMLDERAVGDGGDAYGIAQWQPHRQADFAARYGKDIRDSTFEEQLEFIQHELTGGSMRKAGNLLRSQSTATGSAAIVSRFYEIPANQNAEITKRANFASQLDQSHPVTNTYNITMHVADGAGVMNALSRLSYDNARTQVGAR